MEDEIMRALIGQVSKAAGGDNEQNVITYITRPLWDAFCRATKMPEGCLPTSWRGINNTRRVYGSETILLESSEWFSFSQNRARI
jgi:hypothetical protein